ncbi:MAG: 1-acyl-sn-glycerol-3-phosphate acyltransferase [Nitrospira sp.]|nr:1-acyl-sn-glycerol-3-phosphate acyltransferase [Nitrospira sp.]
MLLEITYKIIAFTIRIILRLNGGFHIINVENIPKEGGVILAPNHISYLDPPVVGSAVPRKANFMAKKGLFDIPVLGKIIRGAAYPVDRDKPNPSTIKETVKRLKKGEPVVMFPEGQRNITGELMESKRGISMVVAMSRVPVVPVFIAGSDKALPANAKWLKRAKISVVFGKPIYYNPQSLDGENKRRQDLHEEFGSKIMAAIQKMKNEYEDNSS